MTNTTAPAEPAAVERFVSAIKRSPAGRDMTERVFRELAGVPAGHAACLTDRELAAWLLEHDWTFRDVVRRES